MKLHNTFSIKDQVRVYIYIEREREREEKKVEFSLEICCIYKDDRTRYMHCALVVIRSQNKI